MKTYQSFVRVLFATVGRLVGFLFGHISWAAPPWLAWCFRRVLAFFSCLKAHPKATAITLATVAVLAIGSWQSWVWWQSHRPREFSYNPLRKVEVKVSLAPGAVSPGAPDKDLQPAPMRISFAGAPVAPLEKIGKEAGEAVKMDPALLGKWMWRDGSTLEFQPENHWPPETKLIVHLNPSLLAKDLKLDKESVTVTTPPLVAEWREFSFYNSPKDPSVFQVVGELRLSHPIALETLQQKIRMEAIGGTPVFTPGSPLFSVTSDPLSARRFFIRSRQIVIPAKEDWVKVILPAGISSDLAGTPLAKDVETKTRVPDKYSGLKITSAETRMIRTDEGEPQQFVFISTNLDIDSNEVASRIGMWWHVDGWHDNYGNLIFDQRVGSAAKVALVPVESEAALGKEHAFRYVQTRTDGQLFLRIGEGVKSPGGFETDTHFEKTLSVPQFPKETKLLGKGNVLALDGERKLIVQSRAIDHIRITLGRVPVSQFHHLVSLTGGSSFDDPNFSYGDFSENNIVHRWSKVVVVPHENDWQAAQTIIDISEAPPLAAPDQLPGGRGVFFVTVEPVEEIDKTPPANDVYSRIEPAGDPRQSERRYGFWYQEEDFQPSDGWQRAQGTVSKRFIMATDLGLLVKAGADGSRDVFVMALGAGQPVADVDVQALARNGSVLETVKTDAVGHAKLPAFEGFTGDRLPVAVMASKDGDTSYLPFNERQLPAMDYSRFDIEGVLASRIKAIEAFVFTERGVYRPGDMVHAGFITRRRDWQPVLEGLPLSISIYDPRGREVGNQKTRLPYDGFFTCDFPLSEAAALGQHQITVNVLNADGEVLFRLGRAAVRVEEFTPDRMKVATKIDPAPPAGWLDCKATDASVSVQSLFGEPAPDRRVTMQLDLSPADFGFPEWPGFSFYDRAAEQSASRAGRSITLGEMKSDEKGIATFKLPLDTLKDASFRLAILTEAFERDGGRSVRNAMTCLVSPYESVIGWKADGDLETIAKDSGRSLSLVAVGRDLKPVALENLRRRIIEIRQLSVLTKLDNGNYAYVSTTKERQISEEQAVLTTEPAEIKIPTDKAGRFRMEIIDTENVVHCVVPFQIVGKGDESATLEREAELQLQLSKNEVLPGEEIEIFLTAPYAGAGLVTIEREKVISSQWFKAETKGTSVRLKIPDDAEGTYYINAAFVRSTSAPEVFHSPLSYAAAPVRVIAAKKKLAFKLDTPREVRPGTEARFGITSDKPARLVVYAVDEGIHQITGYKLPQPLDFFLRKQALEVRTQQWLDLLLPEFRFLKAAPAFGGDGDDEMALSLHLNPFKRRQESPVVFWSGIIEAGPQRKEVTWNVPDYFNGNLRVMAVGCQAGGIGAAESATLVKAPIILQPNTPLFVTPGDEFEVSVSVFNHLAATGVTPIQLKAASSEHLEAVGESSISLPLENGREGIARFRFRAKDQLGGADLRFEASGGGETVKRSTTLSVRPATHHLTSVVTGWFRTGSTEEKVKRTLYPQFRHTEATASIVPLGLARGLEAYVREYPYGCSEQITSRAMVKLIAATEADFGLSQKDAADALRSAISQLASRQRADG
ncbi:MAG: MG2 domain-containing protein, partial [Luteolibacter sp.]